MSVLVVQLDSEKTPFTIESDSMWEWDLGRMTFKRTELSLPLFKKPVYLVSMISLSTSWAFSNQVQGFQTG